MKKLCQHRTVLLVITTLPLEWKDTALPQRSFQQRQPCLYQHDNSQKIIYHYQLPLPLKSTVPSLACDIFNDKFRLLCSFGLPLLTTFESRAPTLHKTLINILRPVRTFCNVIFTFGTRCVTRNSLGLIYIIHSANFLGKFFNH